MSDFSHPPFYIRWIVKGGVEYLTNYSEMLEMDRKLEQGIVVKGRILNKPSGPPARLPAHYVNLIRNRGTEEGFQPVYYPATEISNPNFKVKLDGDCLLAIIDPKTGERWDGVLQLEDLNEDDGAWLGEYERDFDRLILVAMTSNELPTYKFWQTDEELAEYNRPKGKTIGENIDEAIAEIALAEMRASILNPVDGTKSRPMPFITERHPAWIERWEMMKDVLENHSKDSKQRLMDVLEEHFTEVQMMFLMPTMTLGSEHDELLQTQKIRYRNLLESESFLNTPDNLVTKLTMVYFGLPIEPLTLKNSLNAGKDVLNDDDPDDPPALTAPQSIMFGEKPLEFLDRYHERFYGYPGLRIKYFDKNAPKLPVPLLSPAEKKARESQRNCGASHFANWLPKKRGGAGMPRSIIEEHDKGVCLTKRPRSNKLGLRGGASGETDNGEEDENSDEDEGEDNGINSGDEGDDHSYYENEDGDGDGLDDEENDDEYGEDEGDEEENDLGGEGVWTQAPAASVAKPQRKTKKTDVAVTVDNDFEAEKETEEVPAETYISPEQEKDAVIIVQTKNTGQDEIPTRTIPKKANKTMNEWATYADEESYQDNLRVQAWDQLTSVHSERGSVIPRFGQALEAKISGGSLFPTVYVDPITATDVFDQLRALKRMSNIVLKRATPCLICNWRPRVNHNFSEEVKAHGKMHADDLASVNNVMLSQALDAGRKKEELRVKGQSESDAAQHTAARKAASDQTLKNAIDQAEKELWKAAEEQTTSKILPARLTAAYKKSKREAHRAKFPTQTDEYSFACPECFKDVTGTNLADHRVGGTFKCEVRVAENLEVEGWLYMSMAMMAKQRALLDEEKSKSAKEVEEAAIKRLRKLEAGSATVPLPFVLPSRLTNEYKEKARAQNDAPGHFFYCPTCLVKVEETPLQRHRIKCKVQGTTLEDEGWLFLDAASLKLRKASHKSASRMTPPASIETIVEQKAVQQATPIIAAAPFVASGPTSAGAGRSSKKPAKKESVTGAGVKKRPTKKVGTKDWTMAPMVPNSEVVG